MNSAEQDFAARARRIPSHGVGLSVDVYTPDVYSLTSALAATHVPYGYLEIFKADARALQAVRAHVRSLDLEYHADGLWVTQPDWLTSAYAWEHEQEIAARHVDILQCHWINQECASKQMAGHAFGTYLPPIFSLSSAEVTAAHSTQLQRYLDDYAWQHAPSPPLLLIETPPLTYFGFGSLPYAEYFRAVADRCACGLVLDIGHVWTVYRYSGAWQRGSVERFLGAFMSVFPMERVIQIHLAGLDCHPSAGGQDDQPSGLPLWVDAHEARIPPVLYEMLEHVMGHPALVNLKGLAMEVDNKPVECILDEFLGFSERWMSTVGGDASSAVEDCGGHATLMVDRDRFVCSDAHSILSQHYRDYVAQVTDADSRTLSMLGGDESAEGVDRYRDEYLPYEILIWGGDVEAMFPETVACFRAQGYELQMFSAFWHEDLHSASQPYDYFLIKVQRFVAFIRQVFPEGRDLVEREAEGLLEGYKAANQGDVPPTVM